MRGYRHDLLKLLLALTKASLRVKGLYEKLAKFISASTGETEFAGELNALISIHFIEAQLKHVVVEVETRSNQIFAPNAIGRKSCDVLSMHGNKPASQNYKHPKFSKRNLANYIGDDVGPFSTSLQVDGLAAAHVPANVHHACPGYSGTLTEFSDAGLIALDFQPAVPVLGGWHHPLAGAVGRRLPSVQSDR